MPRRKAKAVRDLEAWERDARRRAHSLLRPTRLEQMEADLLGAEDSDDRAERLEAEREEQANADVLLMRRIERLTGQGLTQLQALRKLKRFLPPPMRALLALHEDPAAFRQRIVGDAARLRDKLRKQNARSPASKALASRNRTASRRRNGTYASQARDPVTKRYIKRNRWP